MWRFYCLLFLVGSLLTASVCPGAESAEVNLDYVAQKAYDHEMGGFETDGNFDPKALALLKRSFVDMGILQSEPQDGELVTTQFVPVKLD